MTTTHFDPNAAASADSGIFGLPGDPAAYDAARLVYLPVPWEATTSYGGGTSQGPRAILAASRQVDLYDLDVERPYEAGLYMLAEDPETVRDNEAARAEAMKVIAVGGAIDGDPALAEALAAVNRLSDALNERVYRQSRAILGEGKILALVGGDHSTPWGAIRAAAEAFGEIGVLHFDAHSDTRVAYEGFTHSHASIMHNVLARIPGVTKLTQVGIRDVCEQEIAYCREQGARVSMFTDRALQAQKFLGVPWARVADEIVASLPPQVWVSFDIDGLDPRFCPHTGTPVPGGVDFAEANFLLGALARSGRRIIGFDLNEVAPNLADPDDEWDANVGARLLYKLTGWTLVSQGLARAL